MRRLCTLSFACTLLFLASAAGPAVAQSSRHVTLGPDASADRRIARCGRAMCFDWRVTGFATTGITGRITDITSTRTGRIVAATSVGLLFTDDRGASWQLSRGIEGAVFGAAFDTGSDFGIAVGLGGRVWSTEDGGLTWRNRRDDTGVTLVRVCVVGHVTVFASLQGTVWMSTDGGTSVRVLIDAPSTTLLDERVMETLQGAIWVRDDAGMWLRVAQNGEVESRPALGAMGALARHAEENRR